MRAALAGLTTRGRSFLAAGVTACGCGLVLAETDLLRVGVFLCALPLVTTWLVARTRYRLSCRREVDPVRVPAGQPARVTLTLENLSRLPVGGLRLEEQIPYSLGGRPRFVLGRLEGGGKRHISYDIASEIRGHYTIGPLAMRISDPLGLVELHRSFTASERFVVTPHVVALPAKAAGGQWAGAGDSLARAVSAAGEDDTTTREYRHGDDLRRVHWRSTARYGDLMVRREEQPRDSRGVLLLDSRVVAHRGTGPGSSFEWGVVAAASIGVHLCRAGYALTALDDAGGVVTAPEAGWSAVHHEGVLLDALAAVTQSRGHGIADGLAAVHRAGNGGAVIAVLGALSHTDIDALRRFRTGGLPCIAILLDVDAWGQAPEVAPPASVNAAPRTRTARDHLVASGWHVAIATPYSDLRALWAGAVSRDAA